jgi:PPOX class probable F420-dependent enzyme
MTMLRRRPATADRVGALGHDPAMNASALLGRPSRTTGLRPAVPSPVVEARLQASRVAWLSTTSADGVPAIVPVWFVWDGASFLVFSKPHARKVRNISQNGRVMLAIGEPEDDFDVQLIEGRAELLDGAVGDRLRAEIATKYRAWLDGIGLETDEFDATYAQAIRITPTRFLPWRGRTWIGQSRRVAPSLAARSIAAAASPA